MLDGNKQHESYSEIVKSEVVNGSNPFGSTGVFDMWTEHGNMMRIFLTYQHVKLEILAKY
jgi:hypothetical protein